MSQIRTHRIATAAYQIVDAHQNDENRKKYGALAHKLPGLILQNGLAQASGFLIAKGNQEHTDLLNDLNQVLRASGAISSDNGCALHQIVIASELRQNQLLTRRALEAASWIKRYVQGVLRINATGEDQDNSEEPPA